MKENDNFNLLCLPDGVDFPHKNGQTWVVAEWIFFSPVFMADLKCRNYFCALEMLSDIINWGRAETEGKKKVLNFFFRLFLHTHFELKAVAVLCLVKQRSGSQLHKNFWGLKYRCAPTTPHTHFTPKMKAITQFYLNALGL